MDAVALAIILGSVMAGAAAVQHFYDRYATNGLYQRTLRTSHEGLDALRGELVALREGFHFEPDTITKGITDGMRTIMAEEEQKLAGAIPPEITGAIGGTIANDRRRDRELKAAIGEGVLGPYGSILRQFLPSLYEYLTENPDMAIRALEMPVVQNLIKKASSMLGQVTQGQGGSGWGV